MNTREIISSMVDSAERSKKYKTVDGVTIFRVSMPFGSIGIISTLAGVVFAFLAVFKAPPAVLCWICFAALFGGLGLPLFLDTIISRVYVDSEKITYRNAIGIKRSICWPDIEGVYRGTEQGGIRVYGDGKCLKIGSQFAGFGHLKAVIEKEHPGALKTITVKWRNNV